MNQYYFAAAYGEGYYGECDYQATTSCATAGGSTNGTGSSGGTLANTGLAIAVIVTLACLLIFVSLIVRVWRRKKVAEPVLVEAASDDEITNR